MDGGI